MNTKKMTAAAVSAAAVALTLAGCTSNGHASPDGQGPTSQAARFVACLTTAGVKAKVDDKGYVLVEAPSLDSAGGMSLSIGSDSNAAEAPLFMVSDSDGTSWIAAASAAYFADQPDTQASYEACEAEQPDFVQPEFTPEDDPAFGDMARQQAEDSLAFARCARDAGFAWVADPAVEPGASPAIALPPDLGEEEFRALLEACASPNAALAWMIEDDLGFDWQAVLDGVLENSATGVSIGAGQ